MKKQLLITLISLVFMQFQAWGSPCMISVDPSSIQINWTAFKTMQKLAVKGSFTEVTLIGELEGATLTSVLSQLEAEIVVKDASSIRTGNPGRDQTLFQHFFSDFKKGPRFTAAMKDLKGTDQEGDFSFRLSMNQKTRSIPMHYKRSESGIFEATGSLDVLDFGLLTALSDLNKTCEVLHRGPDGVSKTWSQVDLKIVARIGQMCKP